MKLIVDLHSHTNLDPVDGNLGNGVVKYDYIQALERAKSLGISVLSFTHHRKLIYTQKMRHDAQKRGILLIPGVEAVIEGKDVVLLNPTTDKIMTFAQLTIEKRRNEDLFVLAPHPFYPGGKSLGLKLLKNIDLFDGIEYCHFYTHWFNLFNWLAMFVCVRNSKSLIGTSDSHRLDGFGITKSIVKVDNKSVTGVLNALRNPKNIIIKTKPVSFSYFVRIVGYFLKSICKF